MLGTKEVAARLKLTPKELRSLLRKISGKATGELYEWKETDPFLSKLPHLVKELQGKTADQSARRKK